MEINSLKKFKIEALERGAMLFFAPGRVNLIGDHTDYSGGLVLPAAIQFGTYLAINTNNQKKITFSSWNFDEKSSISITEIHNKTKTWVDYPLGVINQLMKKGLALQGMDLFFYGDIPNGAGLSSSASIEMVSAYALNEIFSLQISLVDLSLLSQKAENEFAGVSCGIMDQFAVGLGEPRKAVFLNCRNLDYQLVDADLVNHSLVVINTNKQRTLAGSKYNERVAELTKILDTLNVSTNVPYLGSLSEKEYHELQNKICDKTLLKRFRHVTSENERVKKAVKLLINKQMDDFGKLMFLSHWSLAKDYEVSCKELDTLVEIASTTEGVSGARMTGAGFGGCTVNLVQNDAVSEFKKRVARLYPERCGLNPSIFDIQLEGKIMKLA